MIGISASTFDYSGSVILSGVNLESDIDSGERRVTKYKTLNGGIAIYDNGYVSADTKYSVRVKGVTENTVKIVRNLIANYATVIITSYMGAFKAVLSQYRYSSGELSITIDLIESA